MPHFQPPLEVLEEMHFRQSAVPRFNMALVIPQLQPSQLQAPRIQPRPPQQPQQPHQQKHQQPNPKQAKPAKRPATKIRNAKMKNASPKKTPKPTNARHPTFSVKNNESAAPPQKALLKDQKQPQKYYQPWGKPQQQCMAKSRKPRHPRPAHNPQHLTAPVMQ